MNFLVVHTTSTIEFHQWKMLSHHFKYKWLNTITENVTSATIQNNIRKKFQIPTATEIEYFKKFISRALIAMLSKKITNYAEYLYIELKR